MILEGGGYKPSKWMMGVLTIFNILMRSFFLTFYIYYIKKFFKSQQVILNNITGCGKAKIVYIFLLTKCATCVIMEIRARLRVSRLQACPRPIKNRLFFRRSVLGQFEGVACALKLETNFSLSLDSCFSSSQPLKKYPCTVYKVLLGIIYLALLG